MFTSIYVQAERDLRWSCTYIQISAIISRPLHFITSQAVALLRDPNKRSALILDLCAIETLHVQRIAQRRGLGKTRWKARRSSLIALRRPVAIGPGWVSVDNRTLCRDDDAIDRAACATNILGRVSIDRRSWTWLQTLWPTRVGMGLMSTHILRLSANEVVRLLRAANQRALGAPELNASARREFLIKEEFDSRACGIQDATDFDLVTSITTLSIEPRVESGYWILEAVVERVLGPVRISDEGEFAFKELSLDEFEEELRVTGRKRIFTRLQVQTPAERKDFGQWLETMQARHPRRAAVTPAESGAARGTLATAGEPFSQAAKADDVTTRKYWVREAVGVFADAGALEAAIDELESSGFDRAAISVLATVATAREQLGRIHPTMSEIQESAAAPRSDFVSGDSWAEGQGAPIGVPLYIGGVAGIWAVTAMGGSLALAVAAALALGSIGEGLGAVLAEAINHQHMEQIEEQLKMGGLVLWVNTPDAEAEKRAIAILTKAGACDVHTHEIQREASEVGEPIGRRAARSVPPAP